MRFFERYLDSLYDLVLKNHMNAWLPIMSSWNGRVLLIDAFAGSGEYSGGEPRFTDNSAARPH